MTRRNWILTAVMAMPLAVAGGFVFANSQQAASFICPVTGEPLRCEKCCPLNGANSESQKTGAVICPITGDELPCKKCCPLN